GGGTYPRQSPRKDALLSWRHSLRRHRLERPNLPAPQTVSTGQSRGIAPVRPAPGTARMPLVEGNSDGLTSQK
ncbi:MAG: hypothetical protein OXE78_03405, partial [Gammaproteobacteria bacterium]|nr:hypothetical protein [Gammaproteobacteria bacterium]